MGKCSFNWRRVTKTIFSLLMVTMLLPLNTTVYAAAGRTAVVGTVYEFDKDSKYEFAQATVTTKSDQTDTFGNFSVAGQIAESASKNGVSAYTVEEGNMSIFYSYTDELLNADEDSWHLVEDSGKKVDLFSLDSKIGKGTIIVQTSKDRKNWVNVGVAINLFAEVPVNTAPIYSTQDIQLINGCYYRVIVAYELGIRTEESKIVFIDTSDYEYKKVAEVYEFYACRPDTAQTTVDIAQTYNLGTAVRCEQFTGYAGEKPIEKSDPHYNMTIGQFFVSGYTDKTHDEAGNMVFLKNVGNKVTLWFSLKENIDAIKGNVKIKITPDNNGSDQYFQTPPTDFGRGALIIRYTDYNNNATEPQIYTNYLEANASVGADTKVSLFEEGDYEVALDYEVTEDKLIDSEGHYRIFFKFSIRNGNCMVYPFDLRTGAELTNSAIAENGFRLDLAKSRYLKIILKREILTESAEGLVEDTRFNAPAKDGAEYMDEGIYTIAVSNQYTGQLTTKKIYVGTNSVLKAYMATGLSIPEINRLVAEGATVDDDGMITLAQISDPIPIEEPTEQPAKPTLSVEPVETRKPDQKSEEEMSKGTSPAVYIVLACAAVVIIAAAVVVVIKKKKRLPVSGIEPHGEVESFKEVSREEDNEQ